MVTPPVVLTVAGTDSGGGAGIAADLATFAALGVHGTCVVAAVTAQDTTAVHAVHAVPFDVVAAQLDAVIADLPPVVVKTGMLATADVARLVARWCAGSPSRQLVVDPVLRATTGAALADDDLVRAYAAVLLPVATVVTPNAAEARALLALAADDPTPSRELAGLLAAQLAGPAVVLTGGPLGAPAASSSTCIDWLTRPGDEPVAIEHPAVATPNDHGTGCTHASALAAFLAHGHDVATAAARAAAYVSGQLVASRGWQLGSGRGPIAHTTDPNTILPRTTIPSTEETA
ncbi:bifunctional hydroxymethylpyrimidine kinase/phosphomethylpyrimidine kinase [Nocardioides jiangxiensis]|uniref:Bifunctional hydroxymethylpyrimidine kinase/phosphomethylpyrimidine kinase n=1 Tax=Nocardioides jiangxiensis TaxID=3064524 RepID=A0ABT9B2C2_9ACTN|nr:bifunctional hydroxymethylpyrimidine kinase/phosphomethylpyrimidine kinase [Nocardioides sp. WY-20]MDO7868882.1 bifunctional hydroxymethylpyrimidine kinase/phosphomethylpyrimidine kinase [Nocardioides sp. WY-20]